MNREEAAREIDNTACCFSDKRFRDAMHMAAAALRGPQPDPETGLAPCGCGMPAICVTQTSITYDGKKKVKYSVKCPKNHVHTDWFDTVVQAVNYWHRAMGCPTK